jgi:hypothetical protein
MEVLLVVTCVVVGLAMIFGFGHGLAWVGRRRRIRQFRKAGRTTSMATATKRVAEEDYVFVKATNVAPAGLWIVRLTPTADVSLELLLVESGTWVEDGLSAVSRIEADPVLNAKLLECTQPVFIDPSE